MTSTAPALRLSHISKRFGSLLANDDISLDLARGEVLALLGENGAGKSTLIKIMAGIDTDFTGEAWPGENITVGYLEQEPQLDNGKTVLENVKDGARATADMVERFNQIGMEMGEDGADFDALGAEMSELQDLIEAFGAQQGVRFTAPEYVDPETGEIT